MCNSDTPNPRNGTVLRYAIATALSAGILASCPANGAPWTFTPTLQVRGTYTDNVELAAPGLEQGATVLDVSPGIRIHGEGARIKTDLTYSLQSLTYLGNASRNGLNNLLAATASLEAIEKWFYIDAMAQVSQQNVSAFGPQPIDNISVTGNRTRVSTYSVSPHIKGVVGSNLSYQLRLNTAYTDSGASQLPRSQTNQWVGSLQGGTPLSLMNWGFDFSQQRVGYADGPTTENDTYHGSLNFRVDPQFSLSVNTGHEKNNFLAGKQSSSTRGFGFQWTPRETTSLVGERDQRLFGSGYSLAFKHRMPMSALSVVLSRDYSSTPDVLFRGAGTTIYSLLYDATPATLTPAERDNMVTAILQASGLSPTTVPTLAYSTNRIVVQKLLNVSYAIIGARNTITFTASKSDSTSVSQGFTAADDFSQYPSITQTGLNVAWSHQLSGRTSLNGAYGRTLITGDGASSAKSTQKTLTMALTTALSPKTSATLNLRHVNLEGTLAGYTENAIFASISFLFH